MSTLLYFSSGKVMPNFTLSPQTIAVRELKRVPNTHMTRLATPEKTMKHRFDTIMDLTSWLQRGTGTPGFSRGLQRRYKIYIHNRPTGHVIQSTIYDYGCGYTDIHNNNHHVLDTGGIIVAIR